MAGSTRLNANSSAFVPHPRLRIVVKNAEGLEVDLSASPVSVAGASLASGSGLRQGNLSPAATPSRPLSIRVETEAQRRKRLADQGKNDKAKFKAEEEEKEMQQEQEQEQKRKEECKAREERETYRIITSTPLPDFKKRPDPLDNTKNASPSLPSARATTRIIKDLGSVPYPEGISSPKVELNINAKNGKFR
jgi:hypothetical protein